MATSITELVLKIRTDSADFKSTMAQVRSELSKTGQTQSTVTKGELSMRQQLAAAASLQRQRSAALFAEWKKAEAGGKSFKEVVDGLSRSIATMQGPLGGVAGRFSSIGSLFTELSSSGAGVAVGIGAIAAAAAGAAVALFKLTQSTAEFQGKMFDLSQQVGVSVETLSTLEVFAATSGGSIEAVTQSIFIFQQKIQDAQDPTSKLAKTFKELGITSDETEEAFRQALTALAAMTDASKQANAAAELFGSRGGKQMLGTLKEMGGDVDGATSKLRKMGLLITTDVARAADKFNDQLAILGFQVRALAGIIGNEAMPEIAAAINSLSQLITDNQGVIRQWTSEIGDAARGAIILAGAINRIGGALTGLANIPIPVIIKLLGSISGATPILAGLASIGAQGPFAGAFGGAGAVLPRGRRTGTGGGGGGGGRAARDTALRDATREAALAEREALLITSADVTENKRALEEQARSIEDFTRRAIELDNLQLEAKIDRITAESDALNEALAKNLITETEYENKQRDLDLDAAEAHQKNKDNIFKLEQERDRQISEARIAAKKRELQIAEEADEREIRSTENRIEQGILSEEEGERQIAQILDEGFVRRRKALLEEEDAYSTSLERRRDINAEIIRLDAERVASAEDAARRIFNAQNAGAAGATRDRTVGGSPEVFRELGQVISETLGTGAAQAEAFGSIISSTFSQIGSAVGEAVKAFVLFGTAQGSFKKFAAEVIASIAQMAAVQAVFELAQGLAMLALAYFFPNVAYFKSSGTHFAAAAMFGVIAGGAAVAGRAIAGNSFAPEGGTAGTTARTGGPEERLPAPEVRDINRRGTAIPTVNLNVTVTRDEGSTVRAFVDDYKSNGTVRKLILNDGMA